MIRASYVLTGSIAVAFAVSGILGTPSTPRIKHTNSFTHFVPSVSILVPTTLLGGNITVLEHGLPLFTITKPLADTASISEAPAFTFTRSAFTDSVTVTEAKVIVTTSTVDTDLSDPDVDTDPVSVSEASVLTIQPAFSDTPIISESPAFTFSKGMPGGSITPSEAAVYASTKVATDSTTPSEAFSVTYLYTDTSDRTINGHYFNETPIR